LSFIEEGKKKKKKMLLPIKGAAEEGRIREGKNYMTS